MRIFRIYSLKNFQTYHTVLLTIVTTLCITSRSLFTYLSYNWKFVAFNHIHFTHSPPLATTNLFFESINLLFVLFFLRFHIEVRSFSICLCLTYFAQRNALKVHPCHCKWQDFLLLLWLNDAPLCVCARARAHVGISHYFFHSSIDEHLIHFPYLGHCK